MCCGGHPHARWGEVSCAAYRYSPGTTGPSTHNSPEPGGRRWQDLCDWGPVERALGPFSAACPWGTGHPLCMCVAVTGAWNAAILLGWSNTTESHPRDCRPEFTALEAGSLGQVWQGPAAPQERAAPSCLSQLLGVQVFLACGHVPAVSASVSTCSPCVLCPFLSLVRTSVMAFGAKLGNPG